MSSRDAPPNAPLLLFAENVTALERDGGRVLWVYDPGEEAVRRFAMTDDRVYLIDRAGTLHCLQLATGQLIGRIQLAIMSAENMLIDAGRIFVASDSKVITLDLDGRVLWEQSVTRNVRHTLTGMGIPGGPSIQPDWSRG